MQKHNTTKFNKSAKQGLALLVVAVLVISTAQFAAATADHTARLTGSGSGKAFYQQENGVNKLSVTVKGLVANSQYTVIVQGNTVGTMTTNSAGFSTAHFSGSVVPTVQSGNTITIQDATATTVLSGNFHLS